RGGPLDRLHVGQQVGAVRQSAPDLVGRHLLGPLPVVVRAEELPVAGDQIAPQPGFLVPQPRLQLRRGHPGRLDAVVERASHLVGAVQQQRTAHRTRKHHHTHRAQHKGLPSAHGQLRSAPKRRGHHIVRSNRSTAMSSVSPPCPSARVSAPSMIASTNAGPGNAASERASSSSPSSPRRLLPCPECPSNSPSVSSTNPYPPGNSTWCSGQSSACSPSAGPRGGSIHSTVSMPCSSIPGCPARTALTAEPPGGMVTLSTVAKIPVSARSACNTR